MTALRRSLPQSMFVLGLVALATLLSVGARAQQPATITMRADRTRITLADELQLTVSLQGDVDGLQPPDVGDFDIRGQRTQRRIELGRSETYEQVYTLRPKKVGTLTIGAANATRDGKVVATTAPITITVSEPKAAEPVSAADALAEPETDDVAFIRWSVPRTSFYTGEPFPLVLQLWVRTELNVSNPELVQQPKLDGLLVEDIKIDPARSGERKTVGGKTYDVYPLTAQLATPLRAGKVLVDAVTIRIVVSQGGFLSSGRRQNLTTAPFHLDIVDVPSAGRPAGFSARNVGQFTLDAKLVDERGAEVTRTRTGQRLILRAEVRGNGNLVALEPPRIDDAAAPGAFTLAPLSGTNDDRVEKSAQGMSGLRVFQWLVSAQRPGNLTTPTLRLEAFDPVAQRFTALAAPGRPIEVSGAAISAENDQASAVGEDVGPIIESARLARGKDAGLARSPLYWGVLLLPLVGYAFVELRFRRGASDRKNPGARAARGAGHNAKKRLRAAEQAARDGLVKDFYGQLARTLTAYLEERANIPATGMTHHEARQAARAAGYPADLVDAWVVEMENCDFARFAPTGSAADKMREALTRVSVLVDRLERIQPERRP